MKLTKFLPLYGGVFTFYYTNHVTNRLMPHVHRALLLNRFANGPNLDANTIQYVLLTSWDEIPSFSQRTGLGPVRKSYYTVKWGLRSGISMGIRKKQIRIGNSFDCVEGVTSTNKMHPENSEFWFVSSFCGFFLHGYLDFWISKKTTRFHFFSAPRLSEFLICSCRRVFSFARVYWITHMQLTNSAGQELAYSSLQIWA